MPRPAKPPPLPVPSLPFPTLSPCGMIPPLHPPVVILAGGTDPPEVAGGTALKRAKFYRPPPRNLAYMKCQRASRFMRKWLKH